MEADTVSCSSNLLESNILNLSLDLNPTSGLISRCSGMHITFQSNSTPESLVKGRRAACRAARLPV